MSVEILNPSTTVASTEVSISLPLVPSKRPLNNLKNYTKATILTLIMGFILCFAALVFLIIRPQVESKPQSNSKSDLSDSDSGSNPKRPSNRILGGKNATLGELPYQISIQAYNYLEKEWEAICGGCIIDPQTILSAAHCIQYGSPDSPQLYRIVAGENNLFLKEGTEQEIIVETIFVHPQWDDFTHRNDVALFFLQKSLHFNAYVHPIRLPPQGHIARAQEGAIVSGWGTDGESAPIHSILQKLEIPIYDRKLCNDSFGDDFTEAMICAGIPEGDKDACSGDSGGPLVAHDIGYKYLAGIVSWGIGCGRPGTLGFYTEVSAFTSWIQFVILEYHKPGRNQTLSNRKIHKVI